MNSSTEDPAQGEGKWNDGDSSVYGIYSLDRGGGSGGLFVLGVSRACAALLVAGAGDGRAGPSDSLPPRPARRVHLSAAISKRGATFWDLEGPSSVQVAEMRAPCSELSAIYSGGGRGV